MGNQDRNALIARIHRKIGGDSSIMQIGILDDKGLIKKRISLNELTYQQLDELSKFIDRTAKIDAKKLQDEGCRNRIVNSEAAIYVIKEGAICVFVHSLIEFSMSREGEGIQPHAGLEGKRRLIGDDGRPNGRLNDGRFAGSLLHRLNRS